MDFIIENAGKLSAGGSVSGIIIYWCISKFQEIKTEVKSLDNKKVNNEKYDLQIETITKSIDEMKTTNSNAHTEIFKKIDDLPQKIKDLLE